MILENSGHTPHQVTVRIRENRHVECDQLHFRHHGQRHWAHDLTKPKRIPSNTLVAAFLFVYLSVFWALSGTWWGARLFPFTQLSKD